MNYLPHAAMLIEQARRLVVVHVEHVGPLRLIYAAAPDCALTLGVAVRPAAGSNPGPPVLACPPLWQWRARGGVKRLRGVQFKVELPAAATVLVQLPDDSHVVLPFTPPPPGPPIEALLREAEVSRRAWLEVVRRARQA